MLFITLGYRKTWTFFFKRHMEVLERPQSGKQHHLSAD